MKNKMFLIVLLFQFSILYSQRNCATSTYYNSIVKSYPEMSKRFGIIDTSMGTKNRVSDFSETITIPVIIHIVYKTGEQNISEEQIKSQIASLNTDFKGTNQDISKTPEGFKSVVSGDCQIQFRIEKIIRKKTPNDTFYCVLRKPNNNSFQLNNKNEPIKFSKLGGSNNLSSQKYLNVWVGNIIEKRGTGLAGLFGYATFPGGPANYDGVVINYKTFGFKNCLPGYDRGRTLTHEVGHWLNLKHVWGMGDCNDDDCASDDIDDTPTQKTCNFYCPTYPSPDCENSSSGAMFMNYMDYVDDSCMVMFSQGQKEVMRASMALRRFRLPLLLSSTENLFNFHKNIEKNNDAHTPYVEDYEEIFSSNTTYLRLNWKSILSDSSSIVSVRGLEDNSLTTVKTSNNEGKVFGLKPGSMYEISVGKFVGKGEPPIYSSPFIFVPSEHWKKKPTGISIK